MLSAFTARPIVVLQQKDTLKIESILAYGDRLLVGLNSGSLRIYRITEISNKEEESTAKPDNTLLSRPNSSSTPDSELMLEFEKFSTRAVTQLTRIKEANVLISLSNSYISIHNLHTYALQEQLMITKGTSCFAVTSNIVKEPTTGIPEIVSRLAVAMKKKFLTWASETKIICGMNSGYTIINIINKNLKDIVGPRVIRGALATHRSILGKVSSVNMGNIRLAKYLAKPLATNLINEEMLLTKDINSLFITTNGEPLGRMQVPWQQVPDAIRYSYPYILSLHAHPEGTLEVKNQHTLSLLQVISLPGARQLYCPPQTASLAHSGKDFHVASYWSIWRMGATDYDLQVSELVKNQNYDEAISILDTLEDALLKNKEERLREIKTQKARMLFNKGKFADAIAIFSAVKASPESVISLYPTAIAGDLSIFKGKHVGTNSGHVEAGGGTNGDTPVGASHQATVGSSELRAINKLFKSNYKQSRTSSIRLSMKSSGGAASDLASTSMEISEDSLFEGQNLVNAAFHLSSFLVNIRTRIKKSFNVETGRLIQLKENANDKASSTTFQSLSVIPASDAEKEQKNFQEIAKLVDTTLFRCYMLVQPRLISPLFRIANFCDPEVVIENLLENRKYGELIDFLNKKKLHRPALELLKIFGTAKGDDKLNLTFSGPRRTVAYLQNLPPEMIDLILEFAK
ncbi:hypothetical protein B7463_g11359, partial [Scytalidium lignicola]